MSRQQVKHRLGNLYCLVITTALLSPVLAVAGNVGLGAAAAVQIDAANPNFNDAADTRMLSGGTTGGTRMRALVKFDLSASIPTNAVVLSASVDLGVVIDFPPSPVNSVFDLRKVLKDWNVDEITWNSRLTGTPWQSPGASGATDAATNASSSNFVGSFVQVITFASTARMLADVQSWVANPATNFGWMLLSQSETTPSTVRNFGTDQYPDAVYVPMITVNFAVPPLITNLVRSNGIIQFSFNAEANRTYAVEYLGSAVATNWQTLTNFPAPSGPTNLLVTDIIGVSNRFYRVRTP